MNIISRKISFYRLKIDHQCNFKEIALFIEVNGRNIYKSYQQKVKNNIVNFYGESIDYELNQNNFTIKVIQILPRNKQKVLVSFIVKKQQLKPYKKINIVSSKSGYSLNWTSQPFEQTETQDGQFLDTTQNLCELHNHNLYSDNMIQRKNKRRFSVILKEKQSNEQFKQLNSHLIYPQKM